MHHCRPQGGTAPDDAQWTDLAQRALFMWTNGDFSLFLSISRKGRWVLPQFMISNRFLNRDVPKLVPKTLHIKREVWRCFFARTHPPTVMS